tara:strand:- start:183 stop:401 length:219 start_codon:yes stop_codon:yes gene_type:complete
MLITMALKNIFAKTKRDPETDEWEAEVLRAIRHLKSMNDRVLMDIGIPRSEIEQAVRYGVASNDDGKDQHVA